MKIYKFLICFIAMLGASTITGVANADYQHELSIYDGYAEFDDNTEYSYGEINYTFYFNRITSDEQPLAEAAYLQRASSIQVGLFGYLYEFPGGSEIEAGGLGVLYTMMAPSTPFKLEVLVQAESAEATNSSGTKVYDRDISSYGVSLGWFIGQTTSIDMNVIKSEYEYSAPYSSNNFDTTDIFLTGKSVISMGGGSALNVEAEIGKNDYRDGTNTVLSVAADYYFNKKLSIGGSYSTESGDEESAEGKTVGVRGKIFFTERMSLAVGISSFSADNTSGDDYDMTELGFVIRF